MNQPHPTLAVTRSDKIGWRWFAFLLLGLLAAALRLVALDRYPAPINQDELSNIYDGWSIAETGADRSGRKWPILCRGFGRLDERPALYSWLYALIGRWTDCSVAFGRSIAGVVGTATVVLAGVWGLRIAGNFGAWLAMLAVAVCPWHVLFSRMAHEGASLPPFFAIAVLALLREAVVRTSAQQAALRWWVATGFVIGFSSNAYGATRGSAMLFAVLAAVMLLVSYLSRKIASKLTLKLFGMLILATAVGAAPQLWCSLTVPDFFGRANFVRISPTSVSEAISLIGKNVSANLDLGYLFTFGQWNNLSVARCSWVLLPFMIIGLFLLCLPWTSWRWIDRVLLLGGLFITILPAAVTVPNPHALRASGSAVLLPLVAVVGMLGLAPTAPNHPSVWRRLWAVFLTVAVAGNGVYDVARYLRSPQLQEAGHQPNLVRLAQSLQVHDELYNRIYIEPTGRQPDLYIAVWTGVEPADYQQTPRRVEPPLSDRCVQFGRYHFVDKAGALREWMQSSKKENWLILNSDGSVYKVLGEESDKEGTKNSSEAPNSTPG